LFIHTQGDCGLSDLHFSIEVFKFALHELAVRTFAELIKNSRFPESAPGTKPLRNLGHNRRSKFVKVALGLKAHSGWAVLVVLGFSGDNFQVVDRRRIELVEGDQAAWARQPYHAAEHRAEADARDLVRRGTKAAYRVALQEMKATVKRLGAQSHQITACGVLLPAPMPDWTTGEVLAVHFRMHKAEGVLFPDALARAAERCSLNLVGIPEKTLSQEAAKLMGKSLSELTKLVAALGKIVGPPWGKDQKSAALAAMVALQAGITDRGSKLALI